jgi:hypothetical protein
MLDNRKILLYSPRTTGGDMDPVAEFTPVSYL